LSSLALFSDSLALNNPSSLDALSALLVEETANCLLFNSF